MESVSLTAEEYAYEKAYVRGYWDAMLQLRLELSLQLLEMDPDKLRKQLSHYVARLQIILDNETQKGPRERITPEELYALRIGGAQLEASKKFLKDAESAYEKAFASSDAILNELARATEERDRCKAVAESFERSSKMNFDRVLEKVTS